MPPGATPPLSLDSRRAGNLAFLPLPVHPLFLPLPWASRRPPGECSRGHTGQVWGVLATPPPPHGAALPPRCGRTPPLSWPPAPGHPPSLSLSSSPEKWVPIIWAWWLLLPSEKPSRLVLHFAICVHTWSGLGTASLCLGSPWAANRSYSEEGALGMADGAWAHGAEVPSGSDNLGVMAWVSQQQFPARGTG